MKVRLTVALPEQTVRLMDSVVPEDQRSRFIDLAVRSYAEKKSGARLRELLEEGAQVRSERDVALADDWFTLGVERRAAGQMRRLS